MKIIRQFGITTPVPGDGVASINLLPIESSSIPATDSLDGSAFGTKRTSHGIRGISARRRMNGLGLGVVRGPRLTQQRHWLWPAAKVLAEARMASQDQASHSN
jgi:hypothetical protein